MRRALSPESDNVVIQITVESRLLRLHLGRADEIFRMPRVLPTQALKGIEALSQLDRLHILFRRLLLHDQPAQIDKQPLLRQPMAEVLIHLRQDIESVANGRSYS